MEQSNPIVSFSGNLLGLILGPLCMYTCCTVW